MRQSYDDYAPLTVCERAAARDFGVEFDTEVFRQMKGANVLVGSNGTIKLNSKVIVPKMVDNLRCLTFQKYGKQKTLSVDALINSAFPEDETIDIYTN